MEIIATYWDHQALTSRIPGALIGAALRLLHMNADALHPPRVRLQDFEFQSAVVLYDFTARRHPARHFKYQSAKGIRLILFFIRQEINTQQFVNDRNKYPGIGHIDVLVLALDQLLFVGVMLIGNIADNFLNQVLNCDKSVTAAILVNDDGHVNVVGLHLEQEVGGRHGGWEQKALPGTNPTV